MCVEGRGTHTFAIKVCVPRETPDKEKPMIDTKKVENVADNGIAVNDPDLQEAIGRDGTAQELLGADINGNGYVTRDEFIIYQKLLNPIVSSEATVSMTIPQDLSQF